MNGEILRQSGHINGEIWLPYALYLVYIFLGSWGTTEWAHLPLVMVRFALYLGKTS